MSRLANYVRWSLRIRRVEYRIAELPIFAIPVLLTIDEPSELWGSVAIRGVIAFFFMFAFGDLLNCYADRDLDAVYKPQLTEAVYGIGLRGVLAQAAFSAVGALALAAHLAWTLDRWILVPMTFVGLAVAWAYSVEPVRLKGRGLGQLVFYWLGLFVAPMIFAATLFSESTSFEVLVVAGAFAAVQTGVILVNTAEDFPEDRELNVRTAIVSVGIWRGISMALWITVVGAVLLLATLVMLMSDGDGPSWRWFTLALVGAATGFCVTSLWSLDRRISAGEEPFAITEVKTAAKKVPIWMSTVALSTFAAAIALSPVISS